ncbi:hypothetical protein NA56DRAFT_376603 [Hyaloscypha hepaticicola]|uniref:Uncharacterized protein n=1 Tax=Hyaloscypha hepaticicola TaxID=2082293 RepID=A0A2J6PK10_9HELO|nr:hypothetical protein NA56DRAFT_376603 [Hyaloscypha hepaticicola]
MIMLKNSEVVEFRNRVKSRVIELTKLLTTKPYFILAYRRDGVVRMTERFERMWKRKDVYWEEEPKANAGGPRPVKKRKKSKPIRAKTPIRFPNLREEDDAMSELLSAQVDMNSRMELASMAETALEMSVGQEESQTQWLEQSFFDVFGNDDSEFELGLETPKRTVTKSASPDDIIVVNSRITAGAEAPHNKLFLSPTRERQHSEEEASQSLRLESTLSIDGETQQRCIPENSVPSQPVSTSPSQDKIKETEQISGNAENIESLARNAQDPITTFFTPMEDLSDTGWSRASPNQSVSPSVSTTSRSFGRTNSTSTNTSFSQHLQQGASIGGVHMASTCPRKDRAEFSGLDPQRPITTVATQLSDESPTHDETPGFSSNSGHDEYHSPYLTQSFKEPEYDSANRQHSSSMPGSSRSSPLEIVDNSDHPQSPSSTSTKLSSTIAKPPSPPANNDTEKPMNEDLPAAVQPNPGNHSSQNSMSLNNILGPEIEFTPIKLVYHHHTMGKKFDVLSAPSHPPPPSLHSVHTSSSQRAQSSPSHGSIASNPPTLNTDQQRNPTKANPSPSGSKPFYAPSFGPQQDLTSSNLFPSVPNTFSAPPTFSVSPRSTTRGVPVKEKAGTWPLQFSSDTWNPVPPSMVHTPSNGNAVPGPDMMQNPWPNWPTWDTPAKDQSTPWDLSRNYVHVPVAPVANTYSEISGSNSFVQVRSEPTEKSVNGASASISSPAQHNECVEQPPTLLYPQQSTGTSPTEQAFQSQKLPEEQISHQFSKSRRFHDVSMNTSPVSATPLTLDTITKDNSKSADVDDFISSIDDFIQREGGPIMQEKVPSGPTPPTDTTDQSRQLRSHSPQGTLYKAGQMQASQNLHSREQTPNAAMSPGAQAKSPNLQGVAPSERPTLQPEQISSPKPQSPSSEGRLIQELSNKFNESTPAPRTRPVQCPSSSQDLTPRNENNVTLPVQESMAPPEKDTPKRNGSYSFVPPPEAFSPYKSEAKPAPAEARPPPAPVLSTDRRLATTRDPSSAGNAPILTLLIESADGNMNLDTTHSFDVVKNSSSSEFFQFYASVSGTPLSSLTSLEFQVAFGKRQNTVIRRYGSEESWKRLQETILSLFQRAVRKDTHGRIEWQVLVSSE